jgi:tetratricopeptide (TPR) repeat protein
MQKLSFLITFCLIAVAINAQESHKWLRKGDSAYEEQNYSDAEVNYRRALEKESSTKGSYNLGNATYRQDRFEEAIKHYAQAAENAKDDPTKAKAYHNLGNAYFNNKKYQESIEAYKNALRLNPNDQGTKQNLANALRRLPPPQDQQQQQNQQQNNKNQQQKDDKQQPPPPQQQQDQPQKQDPNKPRPDQGKPNEADEAQPEDMSKEEAAKLLEIMDQEEQNVQQKLRKAQSKSKRPTKDW